MSATITAAGSWTPLNIDLTKMAKTGPNTIHADKMQFEQLKAGSLPELVAFIQAMADGYGIAYNTAIALFYACVQELMNRERPTVSPLYSQTGF